MSQRVRDDSAHAGEGDLWGGSGYRTREIQRGVLRVKEDGTGSRIVCGLTFCLHSSKLAPLCSLSPPHTYRSKKFIASPALSLSALRRCQPKHKHDRKALSAHHHPIRTCPITAWRGPHSSLLRQVRLAIELCVPIVSDAAQSNDHHKEDEEWELPAAGARIP